MDMPAPILDQNELNNACRVLFGLDIEATQDFFQYLQESGLKTAYRKRVLETHPDRAKALGQDEAVMSRRFQDVVHAYETLSSVIANGRSVIMQQAARHDRQATATKRPFSDSPDLYYTAAVPQRTLLLGQFLYYSGVISWNSLIKAVAWQRIHRPRMGQIAVEWGMLSLPDIREILASKNSGEKFGEYALRKGFLTSYERMALLRRQRLLQPRIGEYFTRMGMLAPEEIDRMAGRMRMHNWSVSGTWKRTVR